MTQRAVILAALRSQTSMKIKETVNRNGIGPIDRLRKSVIGPRSRIESSGLSWIGKDLKNGWAVSLKCIE